VHHACQFCTSPPLLTNGTESLTKSSRQMHDWARQGVSAMFQMGTLLYRLEATLSP